MLLFLTGLLLFTGAYFALSGIKLSIHPEKEINEEKFIKSRQAIGFIFVPTLRIITKIHFFRSMFLSLLEKVFTITI